MTLAQQLSNFFSFFMEKQEIVLCLITLLIEVILQELTPISCDSIMKELSDLVSNSKKSRIESQLFLEQAKRYVEKLIEQEVQK